MRKLLLAVLLLLPAVAFGSQIVNPASTGAGGSGSSIYPATGTASFPFGVSASTINMTNGNITGLAAGTTATMAVNFQQYQNVGSPTSNILINGGFYFWQRGTSFTGTNGSYTSDRWKLVMAVADVGKIIVAEETSTVHDGSRAIKMTSLASAGVGDTFEIHQSVENYYDYAGSSVSLSVWVNASSATWVTINDSVGNSNSSVYNVGTAGWQQLTVTRFLPSNISNLTIELNGIGLQPGSTAYFDSAMLIRGNVPMDYAPRPIQQELALCQRYYTKSYAVDTAPGTSTSTNLQVSVGAVINTNVVSFQNIKFPVTMRTAPTVSIWDQAGSSGKWSTTSTTGTGHSTSISAALVGTAGFNGNENSNSDTYAEGHWAADGEM